MNTGHKIVLYQAVNQVNGKRYIGITNAGMRKREQRHRYTAKHGSGAAIGAAIRKYGRDIQFTVLAVCPNLPYAKIMEIAAISVFKPEYNCTEGGDGCKGYRHTEEHKIYIRQKLKGNRPWLGRKHSPVTLARMKAARTQYWSSIPHSRKQPAPKPPGFIAYRGVPFAGRLVECLSTGEVFASTIAASRHTGSDRKSIRLVCNGIHHHAGGLAFQYLNAA